MHLNSLYADSPLLSEIHTLFPALLYDPARFRNLQDVFRYVQEQLRAKYDVFSNATREFQSSNSVVNSYRRVPIVSMNFVDSIGQVAVSDLVRSFLYNTQTEIGMYPNNSGGSDLSGLTGAAGTQPPMRTQIENASQQFPFTAPESMCAICQDSIVQDEVVRKLNVCQHIFHDRCLITWFERNSTCPMCRNDIRSTGPAVSTPPPAL
jgi:hypothetical protein